MKDQYVVVTLAIALDSFYVHDFHGARTFQCFRNGYIPCDYRRLLEMSDAVVVEKYRYVIDIDHEHD